MQVSHATSSLPRHNTPLTGLSAGGLQGADWPTPRTELRLLPALGAVGPVEIWTECSLGFEVKQRASRDSPSILPPPTYWYIVM